MSYSNLPCDISDNDIDLHFGLSPEQELQEQAERFAKRQYLNLTDDDKANLFVDALHDFKSKNEEYFNTVLYQIYDGLSASDTNGVLTDIVMHKLTDDCITDINDYNNDIEKEEHFQEYL